MRTHSILFSNPTSKQAICASFSTPGCIQISIKICVKFSQFLLPIHHAVFSLENQHRLRAVHRYTSILSLSAAIGLFFLGVVIDGFILYLYRNGQCISDCFVSLVTSSRVVGGGVSVDIHI
ncbi:hypothetical protein BDN70DRAFT_479860 [Pholiota conissans]|uniref:Uncharacterized protein n=1 Tax=Pholiota conissans TaxID=109636 RepID=A0A9P5YMB5_9AGAR|nr:hypothetical protein BDN70DRAFT_479860 [Pholiota conissans]